MALFSDNHANPPIHKWQNPVLKENFTRGTTHFIEKRVFSKRYIPVRATTFIEAKTRTHAHGVCGQALPSPPLPSPACFAFLLLSQFPRCQTAKNDAETLATQAINTVITRVTVITSDSVITALTLCGHAQPVIKPDITPMITSVITCNSFYV